MSDSGPEKVDRQELRERVFNNEFLYRDYGEFISRYQRAGKLGRKILQIRYPVSSQIAKFLEEPGSLVAQRLAYENEGQIVIP